MVVKKSFIFLSIFFITSLSSICFGATLTADDGKYIFDYLLTSQTYDSDYITKVTINASKYGIDDSQTVTSLKTNYYDLYYDLYNDFSNYANNAWLSAFGKNLNTDNLIFMSFSHNISYSEATDITFYLIEANNTNTNSLDYLLIDYYSINTEWAILGYKLKFYSSSGSQIALNNSNNKILGITIDTSLNFSHTTIKPTDNFFNTTDNQTYLFNSYNNSDTAVFCPYNFCSLKDFAIYSDIGIGKNIDNNNFKPLILKSFNNSSDTGGDTESGDTGGGTTTPDYSEDLDNIQTGITDINNNIGETNNKLDNISGELSNINNNLTTVPDISDTTITDDDITSNLDFEFEQDPYTNFWLDLTTGLGNAFTNNKREISIQFRDKTHIISLDNFSVQIPSALKPFLTIISTVFITWKMLQYIKIIVDNISSGNIDEVLEMNEEEGITNLF